MKVWNLASIKDRSVEGDPNVPQILATLSEHFNTVNCVRFSKNGQFLASGSTDTNVFLYEKRAGPGRAAFGSSDAPNVENWVSCQTLRGHLSDVIDIAWAPDDSMLASCSLDNMVIVWDPRTGQKVQTLKGHTSFVKGVAWDPIGKYLCTQADDKSVIVWRVDDWSVVSEITEPYQSSMGAAFSLRLCWSPDGKAVTTCNSYKKPSATRRLCWSAGTGGASSTSWGTKGRWSPCASRRALFRPSDAGADGKKTRRWLPRPASATPHTVIACGSLGLQDDGLGHEPAETRVHRQDVLHAVCRGHVLVPGRVLAHRVLHRRHGGGVHVRAQRAGGGHVRGGDARVPLTGVRRPAETRRAHPGGPVAAQVRAAAGGDAGQVAAAAQPRGHRKRRAGREPGGETAQAHRAAGGWHCRSRARDGHRRRRARARGARRARLRRRPPRRCSRRRGGDERGRIMPVPQGARAPAPAPAARPESSRPARAPWASAASRDPHGRHEQARPHRAGRRFRRRGFPPAAIPGADALATRRGRPPRHARARAPDFDDAGAHPRGCCAAACDGAAAHAALPAGRRRVGPLRRRRRRGRRGGWRVFPARADDAGGAQRGEARALRVCSSGGSARWTDRCPDARATHIAGSTQFAAVFFENGTAQVYTPAVARGCPRWCSPGARLRRRRTSPLVAVTGDCSLVVWELGVPGEEMQTMRESVAPLLTGPRAPPAPPMVGVRRARCGSPVAQVPTDTRTRSTRVSRRGRASRTTRPCSRAPPGYACPPARARAGHPASCTRCRWRRRALAVGMLPLGAAQRRRRRAGAAAPPEAAPGVPPGLRRDRAPSTSTARGCAREAVRHLAAEAPDLQGAGPAPRACVSLLGALGIYSDGRRRGTRRSRAGPPVGERGRWVSRVAGAEKRTLLREIVLPALAANRASQRLVSEIDELLVVAEKRAASAGDLLKHDTFARANFLHDVSRPRF